MLHSESSASKIVVEHVETLARRKNIMDTAGEAARHYPTFLTMRVKFASDDRDDHWKGASSISHLEIRMCILDCPSRSRHQQTLTCFWLTSAVHA